jgi:hypothetical protein
MMYQCCINAWGVHSSQIDQTRTSEDAIPEPTYCSYLLRRWRDGQNGRRIGFADLERLFTYLRRLTKDAPDERGTSTTTER